MMSSRPKLDIYAGSGDGNGHGNAARSGAHVWTYLWVGRRALAAGLRDRVPPTGDWRLPTADCTLRFDFELLQERQQRAAFMACNPNLSWSK